VFPSDIRITARLISLALSTVLVACQGSDLTLPGDGLPSSPDDGLPSSLEEVSGSGQEGTVGSRLPEPLVVRVTDGAARPLSQVSIRFQTDVPGAEIPSEATTNDTGYAAVRVSLGELEGPQTFHAQVADASELTTTFEVIAVAKHHDDHDDDDGNGHDHDDDGEDD